jgi:hypothetical protein
LIMLLTVSTLNLSVNADVAKVLRTRTTNTGIVGVYGR